MKFTFESYQKLLYLSLENNYKFCSYENAYNYDKSIILRHDIDFSPLKALEIAKIEYEIGVKSTYFVLLSTEFYNVFSKETSEIFTKIISMGHELGLHFDEQRYETNSIDEIKINIYNETAILARALNTEVRTVSMHRPSQFTLEASIQLDGLINSYSNKYFKNMKYISDSRMYWRENLIETILNNKHDKIHILTHPFWYSKKEEYIKNKLEKFIEEAKIDRYNLLDKNFRDLNEYINQEDLL